MILRWGIHFHLSSRQRPSTTAKQPPQPLKCPALMLAVPNPMYFVVPQIISLVQILCVVINCQLKIFLLKICFLASVPAEIPVFGPKSTNFLFWVFVFLFHMPLNVLTYHAPPYVLQGPIQLSCSLSHSSGPLPQAE